MDLEIKGFNDMEGQKFNKWHIFEVNSNSIRYQILAKDKIKGDDANAVAIDIFKNPVKQVASNAYQIRIAYTSFDNQIWVGYVRKSHLKDKSGFFQMILDEIDKYETKYK